MQRRSIIVSMVLVALHLLFGAGVAAAIERPAADSGAAVGGNTASPLLIVELEAPPLAAAWQTQLQGASADGELAVNSAAAQAYVARLQAQQAAFAVRMQDVLPRASVAHFVDENGQAQASTYQVVFNGMAVDPGSSDLAAASRALARLPGVKAVYPDAVYTTALYTSTALINAPAAWSQLGGRVDAGAGVKFASLDGGVHFEAPMFSGEGYTYPPGFELDGKGLTANNNGKIITSRAYFRPYDPPQTEDPGRNECGDACGWPGPRGDSHGVHTASTAAGNVVTSTTFLGEPVGTVSGVAPRAYVMSYKVFYSSPMDPSGYSFYTAEALAAMEDIVLDGADVLNNSWGSGPVSNGSLGDPIQTALANTAAAGVFVVMAAGNDGPYGSSTDNPLPDYITVAATTTGGRFTEGSATVPAAAPELQQMAFAPAAFGEPIMGSDIFTYTYLPAEVAAPDNPYGCAPFAAGAFAGKAALLERGDCAFATKVRNAQAAGADFVVVYLSYGGDLLGTPVCATPCPDITAPVIMVSQNNGRAMAQWYEEEGEAQATVVIDTRAVQVGNTADQVADFSSRGPGIGLVLKPDIAAPGDNILAQGYAPGARGEETHLGYGQASGTSMAAPHVAGAAALLREAYPEWPNWAVKSALMTTAKYTEVYSFDGSPAQPLDMGAGRLDLARLLDPGVLLDPPSLSYGAVTANASKVMTVTITSVAQEAETYQLSTLFTGAGFTRTAALPGFSITPTVITPQPEQTVVVTVTLNAVASQGVGENQGYIVFDGPAHDAHMPVWARVIPAATADVLIIDNDGSIAAPDWDESFDDYAGIYTSTVALLGKSYTVLDTDMRTGPDALPPAAELMQYKTIVWFTGDNWLVELGLSPKDQAALYDYIANGGRLIAMGQHLAATAGVPDSWQMLYDYGLGATFVADAVAEWYGSDDPAGIVRPGPAAPMLWMQLAFDLMQDGADSVESFSALGESVPVLQYEDDVSEGRQTVAISQRDQVSLEKPELTWNGRTFYTTFGLEGITTTQMVSPPVPVALMQGIDMWLDSEPGTVTLAETTPSTVTGKTVFTVTHGGPKAYPPIMFRWDFGDGSAYGGTQEPVAEHTYDCAENNVYTVRVEVTDIMGNRSLGQREVDVSSTCVKPPAAGKWLYLPAIRAR